MLAALALLWISLPAVLAQPPFQSTLEGPTVPWTDRGFDNDSAQFQFAIVSDRTGGMRPGVFEKAVEKLNLLHPEFVMSVGDLIDGYIEDTAAIRSQWAEWDSIVAPLDSRFFALPGNHDVSNDVMRDSWMDRYGRAYYHFLYKDVLFLAFDTNDGDDVMFGREQLDYFLQVIRDHPTARWTLLFMHHPIWNYREFNGFDEIEAALRNRPYTVFAGHTHRYFKTQRQDRNYYILGSTGGGSLLRGPRFGEFDHVSWVTMTKDGPEVAHLQLQGILDGDVLHPGNAALASSLLKAANFPVQLLRAADKRAKAVFSVSHRPADAPPLDEVEVPDGAGRSAGPDRSTALAPIFLDGQFFHHHELTPTPTHFEHKITAGQTLQFEVSLRVDGQFDPETADDLELSWRLRADGPFLEPAYALQGMTVIPADDTPVELSFSDMDVFVDSLPVTLSTPFPDLQIHYTTDGSIPTFQSKRYDGPFTLYGTSTVTARYFDTLGQFSSGTVRKEFRKVLPHDNRKIRPGRLAPGLDFTYFELEAADSIPPYDEMIPERRGTTTHFDLPRLAGQRPDHYGFRFEGFVEIPKDGIYTFFTRSDDGSILYVDSVKVVDNDGSHDTRTRFGNIALRKGFHPIRIDYFEDFLGQQLEVGYRSDTPDSERTVLDAGDFFHFRRQNK
ncbi:MAG: hypothetical protein RLY31_101 [Bacteroidota bacterium]